MLLPILHAASPVDDGLRDSAVALGVAMQLTNILRDVGEDLENGRVYLPAEVLEAASYAPERLRAHAVTRRSATLGRRWRTARRSCTAPWSAT